MGDNYCKCHKCGTIYHIDFNYCPHCHSLVRKRLTSYQLKKNINNVSPVPFFETVQSLAFLKGK